MYIYFALHDERRCEWNWVIKHLKAFPFLFLFLISSHIFIVLFFNIPFISQAINAERWNHLQILNEALSKNRNERTQIQKFCMNNALEFCAKIVCYPNAFRGWNCEAMRCQNCEKLNGQQVMLAHKNLSANWYSRLWNEWIPDVAIKNRRLLRPNEKLKFNLKWNSLFVPICRT